MEKSSEYVEGLIEDICAQFLVKLNLIHSKDSASKAQFVVRFDSYYYYYYFNNYFYTIINYKYFFIDLE